MLVTTLPLFDYLVIRPSFDKFLTENTNDEALKIAKHFVATFLPKKTGLRKNTIRYTIHQFLKVEIILESQFDLLQTKSVSI